jgi:hypothetical protein
MKTILKLTTLSAILLSLTMSTSCRKKVVPYLIVDETPITVAAERGTYSIEIKSNGAWTAAVVYVEDRVWCTLTDASGINKGTFVVNIAQNLLYTPRDARVVIMMENLTKSIVFNQEADEFPDCAEELILYTGTTKRPLYYFFLKDYLLIGFDEQVQDVEIVNYINQTGLFKAAGVGEIFREDYWGYAFIYRLIFVGAKERKNCSQMKETILMLEKDSIVRFASLAFRGEAFTPATNTICLLRGFRPNFL